ncbi:MAG: aspartate ammonia-lyase [Nitrospirae bacterium]|nr:aspartate ammonia-lyase [Nitrospirota bacterium]
MKRKFRIEKDTLGELEVPAEAYYGIQTARAVHNFPISRLKSHRELIRSITMVKWAAAEANMACDQLNLKVGKAIQKAAEEIIAGRWDDQFVVDVFQAGAGTSFNMNANEVIANRAIELFGGKRGEYHKIHPNDDVNRSQSTNDVFPTAMRISALFMLQKLEPVLIQLEKALSVKARDFNGLIKSGRTHLQDAVPIRLGQEFSGYARAVIRARERIKRAGKGMQELGLGGSAVGTGINTHPRYQKRVVSALKKVSGLRLFPSPDLFERMQSMADFVALSGSLRELAVELIRIANDLRLLSSGPRTGLAEINLPAVQPGSSIMPGKVNPVMAEVTNMVCFQVIGNDMTITLAAQAGQLELNVMMPAISFNLLQSLEILTSDIRLFSERCIKGITANAIKCREYAGQSPGLATVLNPYIGYESAARVAKESMKTGKSLRDIVIEKGVLSVREVDQVLDPFKMTRPNRS